MKSFITLCLSFLFLSSINGNAQIFWTENFESGSTAGMVVNAYTGPNGSWTLTVNADPSYASEAPKANVWYVSCAEAGQLAGVCGAGCGGGLGATLHIGTSTAVFGDMGASYDAGGGCTPSSSSSILTACITTNRRAESPTINCTGKSNILMKFYYIENGDGTNDDGSVWYSPDGGTTWSILTNTPKTTVCGSGQGQWATDTITLPASANNNPNVKLGFSWVNNDDGTGTDPSYAIDSVSLYAAPPPPPPPVASFSVNVSSACTDSCITFTSTSTGTKDSIRWSMPGVTIATPHDTVLTLCNFPAAGTYTMHLYVFGAGTEDSSSNTVTIKPLPHPAILHAGNLLSAGTGYSQYIWSKSDTAISGATSSTYTIPHSGTYEIAVDSNGCWGYDSITVFKTGVPVIKASENKFWATQSGNSIILHASQQINENLTINIFDVAGKQILEDTWQAGSDVKQINEISVPPGSYLIKLNNPGISEVLKWTKQ